MRDPGDVSAILRLIDEGSIAPREIFAILGKTEGNGCVNDFTRGYATMALSAALAQHLGIAAEEVPSRVRGDPTTREADDRMIRKALLQGRDDGSRRFDDPASERRFRQDARPSVEKLHNFGARLDLRCEKVDVAIVMSGGTEGGLSPHFLVFGVREYRHSRGQRKSLAIGTASTPVLLPEQIGRMNGDTRERQTPES